MAPCVENKESLRAQLRAQLKAISSERRRDARAALSEELYSLLEPYAYVLSFASMPHEIDTSLLNAKLALEGRLLLPKVAGEDLLLYQIQDLDQQLSLSSHHILEPVPDLCQSWSLKDVCCVLVPGLGFDAHKRRIGYGKGYYDRLMASASGINITWIGLGLHEQFCEIELPYESHDQTLDTLFLR